MWFYLDRRNEVRSESHSSNGHYTNKFSDLANSSSGSNHSHGSMFVGSTLHGGHTNPVNSIATLSSPYALYTRPHSTTMGDWIPNRMKSSSAQHVSSSPSSSSFQYPTSSSNATLSRLASYQSSNNNNNRNFVGKDNSFGSDYKKTTRKNGLPVSYDLLETHEEEVNCTSVLVVDSSDGLESASTIEKADFIGSTDIIGKIKTLEDKQEHVNTSLV